MTSRRSSGFNIRTVLLAVIASFAAFIATLYFIGIGDTGPGDNNGQAHAASKGLNGFAGFARLLELEGFDVELSRNRSNFETYGLLVLTPPMQTDPDEFAQILEDRFYYGPTLVILPKWWAAEFPDQLPVEIRDEVQDGWVQLSFASSSSWTSDLSDLYAFEHEVREPDDENADGAAEANTQQPMRWSGMGFAGTLPTQTLSFSAAKDTHDQLVSAADGSTLAFELYGEQDSEFYNDGARIIFVTEPDLVNNYGLANRANAQLAMEIVRNLSYEDETNVVFDLTLNGLGGAKNLLTLVFTPPFLAATLCLIAAMIMIGWRAFRRFGPPRVEVPAHAFGKSTLIGNSAGLILRAKRLPMLTAPYAEMMKGRIAKRLGLGRFDNEALDAAAARALPDEPPVTLRTNALREARNPKDILDAAQSLHELERKLTR